MLFRPIISPPYVQHPSDISIGLSFFIARGKITTMYLIGPICWAPSRLGLSLACKCACTCLLNVSGKVVDSTFYQSNVFALYFFFMFIKLCSTQILPHRWTGMPLSCIQVAINIDFVMFCTKTYLTFDNMFYCYQSNNL